MNTIGQLFRLTTYGESHGVAIGGIIDGCPAGLSLDLEFIQNELDRRKPGQSSITTPRKESDTVQFYSVLKRYPFLGNGVYMLKGRVIEEFDFYCIEVSYMKKQHYIEDPRFSEGTP